MNKRAEKFIRFGMAVYLAILFMVILPNHHHKDNVEHDDCIVCVIAHLPTLTEATITFVLIACLIIFRIFFPPSTFQGSTPIQVRSRAPPLQ